jgi:hypothetical protein
MFGAPKDIYRVLHNLAIHNNRKEERILVLLKQKQNKIKE